MGNSTSNYVFIIDDNILKLIKKYLDGNVISDREHTLIGNYIVLKRPYISKDIYLSNIVNKYNTIYIHQLKTDLKCLINDLNSQKTKKDKKKIKTKSKEM
jgi:hypothetical protein